jgi:hypothetical protein
MPDQELIETVNRFESDYREYREIFESDGKVDPKEQAQLDHIEFMIGQLRQSLAAESTPAKKGDETISKSSPSSFTLSVDVNCSGEEPVSVSVAPRGTSGNAPPTQTKPGAGEGKKLGGFKFANLSKGEYSVTVLQGRKSQIQAVEYPGGPSTLTFNLGNNQAAAEQFTLSVDVVCAGEESVSVTVSPNGANGNAPPTQTKPGAGEGKKLVGFTFANLSEGQYSVTVFQGRKSKIQTVKYPGGPTALAFNLTKLAPDEAPENLKTGVTIVLLWATSNKPVGGATVNLFSMATGKVVSATTSANGTAKLSGMAPESWAVQNIILGGKTYAAGGVANLADGGVKPMNLVIVPQEKGDDEKEHQDVGPLPVVKVKIPIPGGKKFSYFEVSNIQLAAEFAPKKAIEGVSIPEGFEAELKAELKQKLQGGVVLDEIGGSAGISASGLSTSLSAKGEGKLLGDLKATWGVNITVFKVEGQDAGKAQSGKRIGPLVVTPPTITPQVGLTKPVELKGVAGTLSVTISVDVSPNYEKIAIEVGEKLGLRVVGGLCGTAIAIINNGIYTIYINYKHIVYNVNPDQYRAMANSVADKAEKAFKAGVTGGSGSFSDPVSADAYRQGQITQANIFNELKASGNFDPRNAQQQYADAVKEAAAAGAFDKVSAHCREQGRIAAWKKFCEDHPDTSNSAKMAVAAGLWGSWNNAPPAIKKQYGAK